MSNERDNGGPAFPVLHKANAAYGVETKISGAPGMTLRDYFAAKAMQGLCANPGAAFQANALRGWGLVNCDLEEVANLAYDMADQMLKARQA